MEDIWYKDIIHFITKDTYLKFFPSSYMTTKEQLNAILRFSIYTSVILVLITNNYRYLYIIVITCLITFSMHKVYLLDKTKNDNKLAKENLVVSKATNKKCTIPTKSNPFMNFTLNEYIENPEKAEACDIDNTQVKKSIRNNFNIGLNRGIDDIFSKNASDRQFYSMPNTQIMNDQKGLAEWLYGTEPTCKEKTINCKGPYRYAIN